MDNHNNSKHLAPVVYIAESPEVATNYKWDSHTSGLSKGVVVLEARQIRELANDNKHFYLPYDLTPGEILVRHPYNQGYILATDAEEEYIKASAEGIFLIAQCLGATKIEYKKSNIAEYKREIGSGNTIEYKTIDTNVNVKSSTDEKLLNIIKIKREFAKQEFTKAQFKKAVSIAEERGLLHSSDIRSLIDARDPDHGTTMLRQTIKMEVSSSLNKALDVAFTLNIVPFFKIGSNTKIATQKKLDLCVEWEIEF